jgi:adenosylhomocysteine nucleosidase
MTDIGIIGAMDIEVDALVAMLENHKTEKLSGVLFHTGKLSGKNVVIAKCGIGKVFAAICAESMILKYSPSLIINTGVAGALASGIKAGDVVIADRLLQHDMDTSALGDEKGLISGINRIYFEADERARGILLEAAAELGLHASLGTVATGDKFIADKSEKKRITNDFHAVACEMEGGAIAHTAFVNETPFAVIRAISDSADEDSEMSYSEFLPLAAENSKKLTLALVGAY